MAVRVSQLRGWLGKAGRSVQGHKRAQDQAGHEPESQAVPKSEQGGPQQCGDQDEVQISGGAACLVYQQGDQCHQGGGGAGELPASSNPLRMGVGPGAKRGLRHFGSFGSRRYFCLGLLTTCIQFVCQVRVMRSGARWPGALLPTVRA